MYNTTNNPYSGIKEWKTKSVEATVVENSSSQVTWNAGWYVVTGEDVPLVQGAVCNGDVHLILADGAKLTVTGEEYKAGIQVSGDGNSLTIYGQTNQSSQLIVTGGQYGAGIGGGGMSFDGTNITINGGIVTATGGRGGNAGIGGGMSGDGSNIIINGGVVTADGGDSGAGIGGGMSGRGTNITINGGTVTANGGTYGAGIGGGKSFDGTNITINGGTVTATGGQTGGAGIGGGKNAAGSNIKVAAYLIVKAGGTENPTEEIATDRTDDTDIASSLAGKQYATTEFNFSKYKTFVIAAVNAKIAESDNDNVKAIATNAATAINAATTVAEVNTLKDLAIANITSAKAAYSDGKEAGKAEGIEEGKAEAKSALPTDPEGTAGHTVTITKGDKTLILVNPDKVTYGKQE